MNGVEIPGAAAFLEKLKAGIPDGRIYIQFRFRQLYGPVAVMILLRLAQIPVVGFRKIDECAHRDIPGPSGLILEKEDHRCILVFIDLPDRNYHVLQHFANDRGEIVHSLQLEFCLLLLIQGYLRALCFTKFDSVVNVCHLLLQSFPHLPIRPAELLFLTNLVQVVLIILQYCKYAFSE